MSHPDISIIIVNYNSRELLSNCLRSIKSHLSSVSYEVIVADNASTDGSVEACGEFFGAAGSAGGGADGRFRLLKLDSNVGFAKANNAAAALARGRLLHFLNPDTEIPAGMVADYREALSEPQAVYVNALVNKDGSIENGRMPIPDIMNLMRWDWRKPKAKYWYRGASVIISGANFREIGGWCEDYFLYSEDLELFYALWENGIAIKTLPSKIFHLGGGCSAHSLTALEREIQIQKSTRIFFRRHFPHGYTISRLYLLLHALLHRPSSIPAFLKAWHRSR